MGCLKVVQSSSFNLYFSNRLIVLLRKITMWVGSAHVVACSSIIKFWSSSPSYYIFSISFFISESKNSFSFLCFKIVYSKFSLPFWFLFFIKLFMGFFSFIVGSSWFILFKFSQIFNYSELNSVWSNELLFYCLYFFFIISIFFCFF